ncbi:protein dispatched homolog 1-like [Mercenaria mercenaria]|uniref:protein dispatched homolog 1-like n=1 Tax=Mercenaria mercenaria TaxID=6596 RepID=UPI00234F9CC1|nr:protein dispatched homolog 1-like [Mercenaria mercenaria]
MDIDWSQEQKDARAELEAIGRQQKRRDAQPLLLCRFITRWPVKAFLLTLLGHLSMIGISGILYLSGYDILPLFLDDVPMRLVDEPWDARWFAWVDRTKYDGYYTRGGTDAGFRTSEDWYSAIDMYFEDVAGDNIFTKESLLKMKEIEDDLMNAKDYGKFCKLDAKTRQCVKPLSVLRYFDGTFLNINSAFDDENYDNIKGVLYEASTNNATRNEFRFFLANKHEVSQNGVKTKMTRSIFSFGIPHETFSSTDLKMEAEIYAGENMIPVLEKYDEVDEFKFSYRSEALWMYSARNQAMKDVLWAGASMTFIFLVILLHTRSLWIAGFAILSIFASFFTGNLIYNLVIRFEYIGYFHILSLFIILGIGADNVFVFYDIWRNTACDEYLSVAHRLSDCYKRSVFSMLITSLTTAVAFLSSAITPLLGTRSFGVFSALVVVVNYLSVILYFPTVVIMYHTYFENATWPCCYPCLKRTDKESADDNQNNKKDSSNHINKKTRAIPDGESNITEEDPADEIFASRLNPVYEPDDPVNTESHWSKYFNYSVAKIESSTVYSNGRPQKYGYQLYEGNPRNGRWRPVSNDPMYANNCQYPHEHPSQPERNGDVQKKSAPKHDVFPERQNHKLNQTLPENDDSNTRQINRKRKKKSPFVRFFRNYYFRFVTHKFARWLILLILAGVLAFFIYQASKIEPDKELFNVLPDDHPYMSAYRHKLYSFVTSFGQGNALLSVHLLFGVKPNDISVCHFSDPVCFGKQGWDPNFNPNTDEAQKALLGLCETLRTISSEEADELHIQKNSITGKYNIKCFMDNLQAFLEEESQRDGANWSLPFTKEKVDSFTATRPQFFNASVFSAEYNNNLEIPISYWLTNRYTGDYTNDFKIFDSLIGEELGPFSSSVNNNKDFMYGNNLKFVAVSVGTDIQAMLLGYEDGDIIMEKWEQFLNAQLDKMPKELKTGFQMSSHERWVWITRQRLLVNNAIYGIVIGLCLACPILIIATGNLITGLLATFSLCCTTVCVVGVIVLGGWKLGMIEAMNMCMVVGLSVDYVVHLAEGYTLSLHHDRLSRVRDMLDLMAVSVFFGACTTIGASIFMLFTVLSFFSQFATFLLSTIGFSLLFSMGLFVTLLGIFGPEGETGNVIAIFRRICGQRKQRRRSRRELGK